MGSACTTPEMKEQMAQSRQIERQLRKDETDALGDQKLLLLGTGECGKSTILKQMQILHREGYSQAELLSFREIVYSNIMTGLAAVIQAKQQFSYQFDSHDTEMDARLILALVEAGKDTFPFTPEVFNAINRLWSDRSIKKAFQRKAEYQVGDSLLYFMNDLQRIYDTNYVPKPADVLHIRVPTAGVVQVAFRMKGCTFRVFDVGGQRSERRKWIHLFEDVNAIIYISAINEYDQTLSEDHTTNRMKESIDLFKQICSTRWFDRSSIILFLNKRDLFEEKIKTTPITVFFKDYAGSNNYAECLDYIRKFYYDQNENKKTKKIYIHETCATDTSQVQKVIDSVIDIVIGKNLRGTGMD